jgi:mannosyltransferase OCH1-like enzyme
MIPKIFHQTWKNLNIPKRWKNANMKCRRKYSDYEYMFWTDNTMNNFVKDEYPEFYNTYVSYKYHIQRCDAFRYLVLYKYGGIYLDMDLLCKKTLNSFLKYDLVLAKSSNNLNYFTNMFFMVSPKNPFIKYCIDNLTNYMNNYYYFGKHLHVMNSTGPSFLTKMSNEYQLNNINHYILSNKEFAGDCNICTNGKCDGGIYFKHEIGKTWNTLDSTFYNFCYCNYKMIIFTSIIIAIFFIKYGKS